VIARVGRREVVSAVNRTPSRNKCSVDSPLLSVRTALLTGHAALPDVHEDEGSTRKRSCLRHCATSGKVAGSIPDGVRDFPLTLSFRSQLSN
jgi:hypothetical protein